MMARTFAAGALLLAGGLAHAAPAAQAHQVHQIHQLLTRYHALGQLDGTVLVADHGKVVYQHAFGQAQPGSRGTATRTIRWAKFT
jgi:CubicO group peptidase (beta-lactamase class C family)